MTLRKTKKKGANSKTIELGNKNERKLGKYVVLESYLHTSLKAAALVTDAWGANTFTVRKNNSRTFHN